MFKKVLIANRAEIAVRIIRTCRALGIETVAVYSDADRRALHVLEADSAIHIGGPELSESYLNLDAIIEAARTVGADALHPGYGLLSENSALPKACAEAGIVFIGPTPEAMRVMGDKSAARKLAIKRGVPVMPGYEGKAQSLDKLVAEAEAIGLPVMVKAVAGGGGRGMRLVEQRDRLEESIEAAKREAERAFGDGRLILEKAIVHGRHIEVQVLGDTYGNVVHLGERECSVQRRHQKVIEESPSPAVDTVLREKLGESAAEIARGVGYTNAGTVEFLMDQEKNFYFLEMNTRIQVEHGVTELITGLDMVALQIAIARGERLPMSQVDVRYRGHAIECRIYAEDPMRGYVPSSGRITMFRPATGEGVRNDLGTYEGDEISPYYDPMVAKLLTWGPDRFQAIQRMERALSSYRLEGVRHNLTLLRAVITHPAFQGGKVTTDFLETELSPEALVFTATEGPLLAAFGALLLGITGPEDPWRSAGPWRGGVPRLDLEHEGLVHVIEGGRVPGTVDEWIVRLLGRERRVRFSIGGPGRVITEIDGQSRASIVTRTPHGLEVETRGQTTSLRWSFGEPHHGVLEPHRPRSLTAPMPGLVLRVLVRPGELVRMHQTLIVLEAMKMEHSIEAPYDGIVKAVHCAEGGRVGDGDVLIEMEQEVAG